jgi:KaiC/GvpD/RAD55 family RecA-like ATPase
MATKKEIEEEDLVNKPKKTIDLVSNLQGTGKKGENYFERNASVVTYKTGIPQLDYYLGYRVNVYNDDDEVIDSYPSIGITGGCMVTFIGKPSTSKTTTAVQIAANIVRPFENGIIVHFDMEQAMNYSRIQNLTKFTMTQMKAGKYILRQELTTINDIKKSIMDIYFEKTRNPDKYRYKTGKLNEFGEEIEVFEPTVCIIDSIASMSVGFNENDKKDVARLEEVGSQTERMRITGEIGRFFNEILPYLRRANIILLCINQIKAKPQLGFTHEPSEIFYLSPDEALPGGKSPQFLCHILLKFIAVGSEKYNEEDDGFDGFGVRVLVIKSRGNQAGRFVNLVYDKVRGIDTLRSSINFAKDLGLTGGNKNCFYFNSDKDDKFSLKNLHHEFRVRKNLYKILFDNIRPELESKLSSIEQEELEVVPEEMDY